MNRTGDATFDGTLDELLLSLNQSRFLSIFPRTRAGYTLRLMKKDPSTPIDEAVGLEICQREGLGGGSSQRRSRRSAAATSSSSASSIRAARSS